jgi:tetratricopeptide (TPR) repeat protein
MQDILTLQGQMARSVALEVGALLTPRERLRLATARPIAPEVFDLTVRGWQALNKGDPDGINAAIECFSQAAGRDGTYAPAHAGLSLAYYTAALYNVRAYRDVLPRAKAAAQRAVALDDYLPDAHAALANVILVLDWDWGGADREYRRVIELAPDSVVASMWVGWYLTIVERFDEAIAIRRRALSLDPLSVPANDFLGWTLLYAGRYDECIRQYEKLLDMQPEHPYAYMWLAFNYAATHQTDRVAEVCRKALALAPDDLSILSFCAANLAAVGKRSDALGLMDRVTALSKKTPVEPYLLAYAYAALGDRARALDLLARSVDERSPNAVMLNLDFTKTLGAEPRYQALLLKMNHPARHTR